ncbi:hypothetical protein [Roseovarius salis]|uniref:hypothetical protein n=1 Tax=Roseovarius salis TaxID=3376063 RepID=UPI0037C5AAA8
MHRITCIAGALALGAGTAAAGGLDRSGQSVQVLFEEGNYAEFSFGSVSPNVSGVSVSVAPGTPSGDMADDYMVYGAAYKHDFGNGLAAAFIFDQPFGADTVYPVVPGYFASGAQAKLDTNNVTMLLKYDLPVAQDSGSTFSVYGGPRYETLKASARIPFVAGYSAVASRSGALGYVLGAAWEKPDIAARVSLTYHSEVDHSLATTETSGPLGTNTSITNVSSPESVNLHAQTGIAPGTLLFGSVRWADWSDYVIAPSDYLVLTGGSPLLSYTDDTTTYSIGVGRRFNESWSGSLSYSYEPQANTLFTNLGPTDGQSSIGVGLKYTVGEIEISGGLRYVWIGDTTTALAGAPGAQFNDNDALALGLKVGISLN